MKKLGLFETFAGVGSQLMSLERMKEDLKSIGIEIEPVGISEWDMNALISYDAIHSEGVGNDETKDMTIEEVREELLNRGISNNGKDPMDEAKIKRLGEKKARNILSAMIRTNNIGSIVGKTAPKCDIFTYSFPCQDISLAGKGKGLKKDSGTRSSLLWECKRTIVNIRPKYLLMENVKNLIGNKNINDFLAWCTELEEYGYENFYSVLNGRDFGVPQNRERVFMVSILRESENEEINYHFPKGFPLEKRLKDVLETEVTENHYINEEIAKRLVFAPKGDTVKIIGTTSPDAKIGQRAVVHDPNSCIGALTATDYKQPKQVMDPSEMPEVERLGGLFDSESKTHQAGAIFNTEGLSPTLDTMQGGYRQPCIIKHDYIEEVKVRVHEIDNLELAEFLRTAKSNSKLSNKMIAEKLNRPNTEVEHWFRTDKHFSIPNENIWLELKEILGITDNRFDKAIMEFEYRDGVYDQANRVYDEEGISPTLTCADTDKKLLVRNKESSEKVFESAAIRGRYDENGKVKQNLEINNDEYANAITTVNKDSMVVETVVAGQIQPKDRDYKAKGEERVAHFETRSDDVSNAVLTGAKNNMVKEEGIVPPNHQTFRIRKLTPLECWRLMGFSDEDFYKAQGVGLSNSQLYKQAGNSIIVDCLEHIFRELFFPTEQEETDEPQEILDPVSFF